jgi:hypothetical protein
LAAAGAFFAGAAAADLLSSASRFLSISDSIVLLKAPSRKPSLASS